MSKRILAALIVIIVAAAALFVMCEQTSGDKLPQPPPRPVPQPDGVTAADIPEDNGMHWFLLAAERMPAIDPTLGETLDAIFAHGWRHDAEIEAKIEQCREAFNAVRKGLEVRNARLPLPNPEGGMMFTAKWRDLCRMMTLQALMQVNQGDFESALDTFGVVASFAVQSSRGGTIMNRMISGAMENIALPQLVKTLRSPGVSAEQCRGAAARLAALDAAAPTLADAMNIDAELAQYWFDKHSASPEKLRELAAEAAKNWGEEGKKFAETATAEQCLEMYRQYVDNTRKIVPLFDAPLYEFDETAFNSIMDGNFVTMNNKYGQKILVTDAGNRAGRRGAAIAAAIEAYQRDKGNYPATLDALVPAVLPELPVDPFTGKPFGYTRQDGGYLLYSAGSNLQDDGGQGQPFNWKTNDFVVVAPQ